MQTNVARHLFRLPNRHLSVRFRRLKYHQLYQPLCRGQRYSNVVSMTYDDAGRVDDESLAIDGQTYTASREYNSLGQPFKQIYPNGTVVERTFTDRGQLATVKYGPNVVDTRTYDIGGRLDTSTYGNGVVTDYDYRDDANGKDNLIKQIATTNPGANKVGTYAYAWDANGNKTSETITGAGFMSNYGFATTTYDDANRLTAWNRTDGNKDQSWALTGVGDWTTFTEESITQVRTHSAAHEVITLDANILNHDAKGNLTKNYVGHTYVWDFDNKMVSADTNGDSNPDVTFAYDALGRRVKKGSTVYALAGQQVVAESVPGQRPHHQRSSTFTLRTSTNRSSRTELSPQEPESFTILEISNLALRR